MWSLPELTLIEATTCLFLSTRRMMIPALVQHNYAC